ncbi:MAG TPA: RnfABCDGE type electron transport complex subunit B, partial [Azonexus sp.]|nr:RnfABCDGE type electron transport complex subunit B [Azonexus sp.]
MIAAILSLTLLGAALGVVLGLANRVLKVEGNPVVEELIAMMPGSNCGQCGFPGCPGAAEAIVAGTAPPTCCPPGGKALASAIAAKLGITVDLSALGDDGPKIAVVAEELCIGCCRCSKVCPTDAIIG